MQQNNSRSTGNQNYVPPNRSQNHQQVYSQHSEQLESNIRQTVNIPNSYQDYIGNVRSIPNTQYSGLGQLSSEQSTTQQHQQERTYPPYSSTRVTTNPYDQSGNNNQSQVSHRSNNQEPVVEGYAVQILKQNPPAREFQWDFEAIENVVTNNNASECNISVVSITGAVRKGKSFLLNFLLRYLYAEYDQYNSQDWLGDENIPLTGFSWKGGSERHTNGIWIWSKIFKVRMNNGEYMGIMLMDTQGTFGSTSTMKDNVMIFSLTTMLSSTQIYNLFNNIGADDLQNLQLAIEHGKVALEHCVGKPFQKLLFLVRDWSYPYDQSFGYEGGQILLEKNLEITEDLEEEQIYIRNNLQLCFDELTCFLMPTPGNKAFTKQNFTGQLIDLDAQFKEYLNVLVPSLLSRRKIKAKKVGGVLLKGKNLKNYINTYWEMLNQGGATSSQTILGATAEANNLVVKAEALELYKTEMFEQTAGKFLAFNDLVEKHLLISNNTLEMFLSKPHFGDEKQTKLFYYRLNNEMENSFLLEMNEAGRLSYKAQMQRKFLTENNNIKKELEIIKSQMESYSKANEEDKSQIRSLINTNE